MTRQDSQGTPNHIRNSSPEEEKFVHNPRPQHNPNTEGQFRTTRNPNYPGPTKVNTNDLRNVIKSKHDLFQILALEGQLHLPPFDECNMEFMRGVLAGEKKLISNRDICPINVPRYKEFNAQ